MPQWLPYLLLALTGVVGIAFLWYLAAGGEEEEEVDPLAVTASEKATDPFSVTTEEARGSAGRKSRVIALRESLEKSLETRDGVVRGSDKDRMQMPWFMLVGADGSGKKTILANTGLEQPWGPPIEVDGVRKDAGKWWLYDDAVVLEAPAAVPGATAGSSTLAPDQTIDASIGWNTLLHMLRKERPDSPLNGVVVTIACADLIAARSNPQRLEDQADRIRVFLEETRRFLGVRLPLHVLVTKCDVLPGFRSFVDALPAARRQDVFGWANPGHPEMRFEPTWVDAGFTELQKHLGNLRDELLAAPEQVRDSVGVFLFDSEFADLQEPLKVFVARLMPIGERRPTLFFRGFYFTGDVVDSQSSASRAPATVAEVPSPRVSAEIAQQPHNLVFLRSLFSDRIFREAGLARPESRLRLARDRRVVFAQAASLILALGGGFGLWSSVNGLQAADRGQAGLRADAALLTRVLSGVAIDLDELRKGDPIGNGSPIARRTRDAAVIELVGQMRTVPSTHMRSAFIPTSWFSRLPDEIRVSIGAGISDIVLPVTRQRLLERASNLLGDGDAAAAYLPEGLDESDPYTVSRYLNDVRALSRNIERYNALADSSSGSFEDLSALLEYLFAERIATDTTLATSEFDQALRRASAAPIPVSAEMTSSVIRRATRVVASVAGSAGRQLSPRRDLDFVDPARDLAALRGLGALVELVDGERSITATVGDSAILGLPLARAVRDSIAAQLQLAAVRIAPDTLAPDSSARRLRNVVGQLFRYRLMQPLEGRGVAADIGAAERLRWDVGSIELALSLKGEFLQAVVSTAEAFPGQDPVRLQRALELQLRDRAVEVAASAQRFTPVGPLDDMVAEIRAQALNLEGAFAAGRFVRLVELLDSLGAEEESDRLLASAARQGEHVLGMAQQLLDQNRWLVPDGAAISNWRGVLPLSFAALGSADSLQFHTTLLRHETEIRTLAHAVNPALRVLRLGEVQPAVRSPALVGRWENVLNAVLKYERGDYTSTMGALHRYLAGELMVTSVEACRELASSSGGSALSSDLFVTRMRQFAAAVAARCIPGASSAAVLGYQRLRTHFQTRLAGRYPFIDTLSTARVDAVVSDVRSFMRQFDEFAVAGEPALRSDPALAHSARAAVDFLQRFAALRPVLAGLGERDEDRPAYGLTVAAGQLIDSLNSVSIDVRIGERQVALDQTPQRFVWTAGDAITAVLTPFDPSEARTLASFAGPWAAIRFAQRPGGLDVKLYHPETNMPVPMLPFPVTAPDVVILRSR